MTEQLMSAIERLNQRMAAFEQTGPAVPPLAPLENCMK